MTQQSSDPGDFISVQLSLSPEHASMASAFLFLEGDIASAALTLRVGPGPRLTLRLRVCLTAGLMGEAAASSI